MRVYFAIVQTTIAFVGQCHTAGYPGVPPDSTFPQVLRRTLEARRPDTTIDIAIEVYQHPADLPTAIQNLLRKEPQIIVIEVVGWLAIKGDSPVDLSRLPVRIRSAYDRVRHFRHVSQALVAHIPGGPEVLYAIQETAFKSTARLLQPILPRRGRTTLEEYEAFVSAAAAGIRKVEGTTLVIQGPGAPNLTLHSRRLASDAVERYRAVEKMAARVAAAHGALYVDRWDTVSASFYRPGSIRPNASAHSIWGHLLADKLLASGLI